MVSYTLGNRNPPKKILAFQETDFFYNSGNRNPPPLLPPKFFIFQRTKFSYISGRTSKAPKNKISYISP